MTVCKTAVDVRYSMLRLAPMVIRENCRWYFERKRLKLSSRRWYLTTRIGFCRRWISTPSMAARCPIPVCSCWLAARRNCPTSTKTCRSTQPSLRVVHCRIWRRFQVQWLVKRFIFAVYYLAMKSIQQGGGESQSCGPKTSIVCAHAASSVVKEVDVLTQQA